MSTRKFMSSIKSLTQKFTSSPKPEEEVTRESRVYQRFDLQHSNLFQAHLPDGSTAPLLDLSFGGLRLGTVPEQDSIPIVISVLGRKINSQIGVTHRGSQFIGSHFDKKEAALLTFLQPLLGALQQGLSMRRIEGESLKDSTRKKFEWVLRGEGPTDLLIASTAKPTEEVLLTFRVDKEYWELNLKAGLITTGRTIDDQGSSARMAHDKDPDPKVIEQAILILTGAMAQSELQPVLGPVVEELKKKIGY